MRFVSNFHIYSKICRCIKKNKKCSKTYFVNKPRPIPSPRHIYFFCQSNITIKTKLFYWVTKELSNHDLCIQYFYSISSGGVLLDVYLFNIFLLNKFNITLVVVDAARNFLINEPLNESEEAKNTTVICMFFFVVEFWVCVCKWGGVLLIYYRASKPCVTDRNVRNYFFKCVGFCGNQIFLLPNHVLIDKLN